MEPGHNGFDASLRETRTIVSTLIGLVLGVSVGWAAHEALQVPSVISALVSLGLYLLTLWVTSPWRADGRANRPGEGVVEEVKRQWSRPAG